MVVMKFPCEPNLEDLVAVFRQGGADLMLYAFSAFEL